MPDVATGMIALLIPLILLYELGILLAVWSEKKAKAAEAAEAAAEAAAAASEKANKK